MFKKTSAILLAVCVLVISGFLFGQNAKGQSSPPAGVIETDIVTVSVEQQYKAVRPGSQSALAVHFELKKDWHFYASAQTPPGGINLKVKAAAKNHITFSEPIFPQSHLFLDKFSNEKIDVFSDKFTVFLPFSVADVDLEPAESISVAVKIGIDGAVCSDIACQFPKYPGLETAVKIDAGAAMSTPKFALPDLTEKAPKSETVPASQWADYSVWFALLLAFLAGVILNIMPCVLPVIPLKVLSIFEQAKESKSRCIAMGLSFCLGILLFFALLATLNIILRLGYGTVFQWGDHFRHPAFLIGMLLLMTVLALFMFGLFTIGVPSSIAGKAGGGKGYSGSVGMGFLAAILSTPCSFAILTAAFAWAQTQNLALATAAIMLIGIGMAAPYAILTSMPSLLKYLPRPGRWMELLKQAMGFVLLIVAVWLVTALPQMRRMSVLYFAVILAFCVWMWGGWVTFNTPKVRKWVIRVIALVLAVSAGLWLLPGPRAEAIEWQGYDAALIEQAAKEQRPVLIEFMADWCLTCKAVEKTVYTKQSIAELIKRKAVLAIKADTTLKNHPATLALKSKYNEPAVPVSILLIPGREEPVKLHGLVIGAKLEELLKGLPDKGLNINGSKEEKNKG